MFPANFKGLTHFLMCFREASNFPLQLGLSDLLVASPFFPGILLSLFLLSNSPTTLGKQLVLEKNDG